jgi:hypothetical protein
MRALALALAACGGTAVHDAPVQPTPPKALDEAALLRDLPGANVALVGGDFDRLVQSFTHSMFGDMFDKLASDAGVQDMIRAWKDCTRGPNVRTVTGLAVTGDEKVMRTVMGGVQLPNLAACLSRPGFQPRLDPDRKYLVIEAMAHGVHRSQSYLALPDGAVYSREVHDQRSTAPTRADLEADVSVPAASDRHLLELAKGTDHAKTVWFAGSGAGTPLAGRVGDMFGAVDLDANGGLQLDLTAEVPDRKLLDQVARYFHGWRDADAELLSGVSLHTEGARLVLTAHLSAAQLNKLLPLIVFKASELRSASTTTGANRADDALTAMHSFTDEMCACKDEHCAMRVSDEMTKWGAHEAMREGGHDDMKLTDDQQREMGETTNAMVQCMTRAMSNPSGQP